MTLVVTHAFDPHARGDAITDAAEIEAVLAEHADKVVRVARPSDDVAVETSAEPDKE